MIRRLRDRRAVGVLLVAVCNGLAVHCTASTQCDQYAAPGIGLVVRDSLTGHGLAQQVRALATDGPFVDTLQAAPSDSQMWGVQERPGTYRLEVSAPGYISWRRDGVTVTGGECHVIATGVRALLMPE